MKAKTVYTLFIYMAIVLGLAGCKNEDDIEEIFVGKTWYITGGYVQGRPLAGDDLHTLCQSSQEYLVSFSQDTFTGVLSGTTYAGKWEANGKKRSFRLEIRQEANPQSQLDRLIYSTMKNATRYEGDSNIIRLHADDGNYINLSINRSPESII